MDLLSRLGDTWTGLGVAAVGTAALYLAVILLTRLTGPRSLAKMSSFDFAATVAVGSTIASAAAGSTPLATGVVVLAGLYLLQYVVALLRRRGALGGLVDNRPLLLMSGAQVQEDALAHARISREELWAGLRAKGVLRLEQVRAVVLETTGDLSVLTGDGPFDEVLLRGVRGAEALR